MDQTLTKTTADALQERMDLQRVSQLVVWSMPMVQFSETVDAVYQTTGTTTTDTPIGLYQGYDGVYPFFTPNGVVPYTIGALDIQETGPVVLNLPEGMVYGVANNLWQEPIAEFNTFKKTSYLFAGPNDEVPAEWDGEIVHTETNRVVWFFRVLSEGDEAKATSNQVEVYPYAKRNNPPQTQITPFSYAEFKAEGKTIFTNTPPTDMGYWEIVNRYVQNEPMLDRDRFFYA